MPDSSVFDRRHRRVNVAAICANIFVPWFLFCVLYSTMSFKTHYDSPSLAWLLVWAGFGVSVVVGILGWRAKQRNLDASWYNFGAFAAFMAVSLAVVAGNMNYKYNMELFYSIETMNTYPNVNAAQAKGEQLMDAGRVYFTHDTGLDPRRAMGFKSSELFCVAPIVTGTGKLASYDFWAVGKNCCSGVSSDFRCGDWSNPNAHSGLRDVMDDERPFYRLAVQQAEAAYGIKATHPIFFHWTQDPIADTAVYRDTGLHYFLIGIFGHFAFNLLCVAIMTHALALGKI